MRVPSTHRTSSVRALLGAILGGWACWATSVSADNATAPAVGLLEPIVVTAKRQADAVADETIRRQVETALQSDPFFYDEHVTVTIRNGVVTLQGMVFDDWDLRNALRIGRKVPGVKRVVNDLEIKLGGE
jgi:osmotically-inducible protein OsmY